ncbi:histone deacetylase complex, catalytic component RPD3, partial [Armillaria borealis]
TTHCPVVLVGEGNLSLEGVFEFCSISSGGPWLRLIVSPASLHMHKLGLNARRLVSSFCYIILGILEHILVFYMWIYTAIVCSSRLLFGDGVEEAFCTTDRVTTCSFHKYGECFPGTGTQEDKGRGKDNVPLKDGITDESFQSIFEPSSNRVLQCGADSLSGDKLRCLNLTMHEHAHRIQYLRKKNVPLILLGGGGYTVKNVARTWTYETACALGIEDTIDPNLPWNEEWFGPRYRLEVVASDIEDMHVKDGSLEEVRVNALEHVRELNNAPSVDMHDTPKESLLEHLGFGKESDTQDKLDERLARKSPPLLTAS